MRLFLVVALGLELGSGSTKVYHTGAGASWEETVDVWGRASYRNSGRGSSNSVSGRSYSKMPALPRRLAGAVDCGDPYHSHWDWNNDQYSFVECMVLVPMIALAVFFERCHHILHHAAMHQTKFHRESLDLDKSTIIRRGHTRGLYLIRLFERASEELMVLGFIAFFVWCCNKGSVFQKAVRPFNATLQTAYGDAYNSYGPPNGGELLHLVEDVHMQLFIAMLIFFSLMVACVLHVENSIECAHNHEKTLRSMGYPKTVEGKMNSSISRLVCGQHVSLFSYHAVREYFIRWFQAKQHKQLQKKASKATMKAGSEQLEVAGFGRDFDFATYLCVHIDEIMDDMLAIKESTWCFLAILYGMQGIIARFGFEGNGDRVDYQAYGIAIAANSLFWILLVLVENQYKKDVHHNSKKQQTLRNILSSTIESHYNQMDHDDDGNLERVPADGSSAGGNGNASSEVPLAGSSGSSTAASVKQLNQVHSYAHSAEIMCMRAIQAIVLFSCFFCARFIGSPNVYNLDLDKYKEIYGLSQWIKSLIVLYIVISTFRILPMLISELNLMLRLPPFVDTAELQVVATICEERPQERYDNEGDGSSGSGGDSHGGGGGHAGGSEGSSGGAGAGTTKGKNQVMPVSASTDDSNAAVQLGPSTGTQSDDTKVVNIEDQAEADLVDLGI